MTVIVVSKEERKEHARTRAEVSQLQDKLELALAEVDILRKQIQREKAQFEQTLVANDSLFYFYHIGFHAYTTY